LMPQCHASALEVWVGGVAWWLFATDEVQQLYTLGSGTYGENKMVGKLICYASVNYTCSSLHNVAVERHDTCSLVPSCRVIM